jgi:hypothetical protein
LLITTRVVISIDSEASTRLSVTRDTQKARVTPKNIATAPLARSSSVTSPWALPSLKPCESSAASTSGSSPARCRATAIHAIQ